MSEVIVKITGDHVKVKGGEYVRDLVRCKECRNRMRPDRSKFCMGRDSDFFCGNGVKAE